MCVERDGEGGRERGGLTHTQSQRDEILKLVICLLFLFLGTDAVKVLGGRGRNKASLPSLADRCIICDTDALDGNVRTSAPKLPSAAPVAAACAACTRGISPRMSANGIVMMVLVQYDGIFHRAGGRIMVKDCKPSKL